MPAQSASTVAFPIKARIPCATYRVQFSPQFTFQDAEQLVPYLHDLGITDLYASPILRAVPGSTHGYDICDHSQLNLELGGMEGFQRLSAALQARGMGLLMDIVPNHMGIAGTCNAWWLDVLENGLSSRYARFFDISWNPVKAELEHRVLLPVLEDQYGNVLDSGKLQLVYEAGAFSIAYGDHRFPVAPRTYGLILRAAFDALSDADDEAMQEYQSILTALSYLPSRTEIEPERIEEREREKEVIKRRLLALVESSPAVRVALEETIQVFNGTPGDPRSFDRLDELISAQVYRLAFWRVAGEEINYRRFFDVNTMAAIRPELPEVFEATHALILRLLGEGAVTGLRVDHPDGLWNPASYFRHLQQAYLEQRLGEDAARQNQVAELFDALPTTTNDVHWPLYVLVEKILSEREPLPLDWAVYGTTGYDFMNLVNGIFVNSANERAFDAIYADFAPDVHALRDLGYVSKQKTMRDSLAGEINALAHRLNRISETNRHYRDFTLNGLRHAIREVIACLGIYRTYLTGGDSVSLRDQQFVEAAVREAQRRNPQVSRTVFIFLRDTLLLRNLHAFDESVRQEVVDFVMRFQQITGPVMAKSIEDTAFYIYNRLVSLNEVGGNPGVFGVSLDDFHAQTAKRQDVWPHAMLSTSTHDTKRSEDVRARLNVLSEIPDEWRVGLATWREMNAGFKTMADDVLMPDSNDEYLLYQSLLGIWPSEVGEIEAGDSWAAFRERITNYMAKATHEAKVHTSWTNPDETYDQAIADFIAALLDRDKNAGFIESFDAFARRVAYFGRFNSLSQTLLKLVAPGVPDIYRGTESWDYSLVDPDNRRPVDYDLLRTRLSDLKARSDSPDCDRAALSAELVESMQDGGIKLYLIQRTLTYRRDYQALFNEEDYVPLAAQGAKAAHVCAFVRVLQDQVVVAVVPRLIVGLTEGVETPPLGVDVWGDTSLVLPDEFRERDYINLFTDEKRSMTGESLPLASLLSSFPVALLISNAETV